MPHSKLLCHKLVFIYFYINRTLDTINLLFCFNLTAFLCILVPCCCVTVDFSAFSKYFINLCLFFSMPNLLVRRHKVQKYCFNYTV